MIHSTAIISPGAQLDPTVEVGPYAVIGEHVRIGAGTVIGPHTVIEGWTEIGKNNRIFQFASVGAVPQDLKFHGEKSFLRIGDGNTIREFATLHRGTEDGGGETIVGNQCLLMAYSHVAHDCIVGNQVILANGATLAGHVQVDDHAILGGLSAVHQFTRVGCHVMISGGSMVAQDIPPYTIAQGDRAKTVGLNLIGLKRRGFSDEAVRGIKQAYKLIFRSGLRMEDALSKIDQDIVKTPELQVFIDFIQNSQRGIAR
ncbi:MAG: acyl-ACP--UDP-N-acetylglucosamine O-acyltransferase [Desulfuromonadales bacterium]|nr:acyl-ACP--UDP-N-acetylglucosamine O-acyltransferase [Desulfuromonadales bacterium]MDW7756452.1 acyl-ACP--UDP-N-acetylglucosamine O-acyltransferase [Desulfuromonadales bacterium]